MVARILTAVSHETYRMYAKQYGIRLTKSIKGKYKYRTTSELRSDIYDYEKKHKPNNGMYF